MMKPDDRSPWGILGVHPTRMTHYLRVRRKPIKRVSRWMLVAGMVLAVQTTYSLDASRNLIVQQATIERQASAPHKAFKYCTSTFVFFTVAGAGVWVVPTDWNSADNKVECIGAGGGSGSASNSGGSGGAGGGAYSASTNLTFSVGAGVAYSVGDAGLGGASGIGHNGTAGGDTWLGASSFASATVAAKGGGKSDASNNSYSNPGAGGSSSLGIGAIKRSGGSGAGTAGGGGGAGGPNGAGNSASGLNGGAGDAGFGGAGGRPGGGAGANMGGGAVGSGGGGGGAKDGGLYGGGAGGQGSTSGFTSAGYSGAKGIIVITYTPLVPPTVTSISPNSGFTLGGDSVTITGASFTGATSVKFGTSSATGVIVVDATTITCLTPAHVSGTVDVSVTTPAGTGVSTNGFTFNNTPSPAVAPFILGV